MAVFVSPNQRDGARQRATRARKPTKFLQLLATSLLPYRLEPMSRNRNGRIRRLVGLQCLLLLYALTVQCATGQSSERILRYGKVNGKPATFVVDTGCGGSYVLFRKAAQQLGLKIIEADPVAIPAPGQVPTGSTEECRVAFAGTESTTYFSVIDIPQSLSTAEDGALGWPLFRNTIVDLNARAGTIEVLQSPPEQTGGWITLRISTNSNDLRLELPIPGERLRMLCVDTGSSHGVGLPPMMWRAWKANHSDSQTTFLRYYIPATGEVVKEESWASEIAFGPLTLTEVPVTEASQTELDLGGPGYEATLGLAALKRMDVVLDTKHGMAYLRPRKSPPLPYQHNRLGALFASPGLTGKRPLAQVAKGGPAERAGIKNGDVLQKIDGVGVDVETPIFWEREAGTRVELSLLRGDKPIKVTVVLEDILGPKRSETSRPERR